MRRIVLAGVLAIAVSAYSQTASTNAQTTSGSTVHHHSAVALIDGANNPELIADSIAYRLLFLSLTQSPVGTTGSAAQVHRLRIAGLSETESEATLTILQTFKSRYEEFVRDYGKAADLALKQGKAPENSVLLAQRDSLVTSTRDQLRKVLSADSVSYLNTLVQTEKHRMKVAVETQSQ